MNIFCDVGRFDEAGVDEFMTTWIGILGSTDALD